MARSIDNQATIRGLCSMIDAEISTIRMTSRLPHSEDKLMEAVSTFMNLAKHLDRACVEGE